MANTNCKVKIYVLDQFHKVEELKQLVLLLYCELWVVTR